MQDRLYESVWHPLTILSIIPLAGIRAVMAMELLTSISLKNAILLAADRYDNLCRRPRGVPTDADGRLRHGTAPAAGHVLIGRLLVSQAQTMFMTPALYPLVGQLSREKHGKSV